MICVMCAWYVFFFFSCALKFFSPFLNSIGLQRGNNFILMVASGHYHLTVLRQYHQLSVPLGRRIIFNQWTSHSTITTSEREENTWVCVIWAMCKICIFILPCYEGQSMGTRSLSRPVLTELFLRSWEL